MVPSVRLRVLVAGVVVGAVAGAGGCSAPKTETADVAPAVEETPTAAAEPSPVAPTAGDFAIKLKVKEQQCFGSAGCNLTVEPKLSIVGNIPDEGTAEITFRVSGDESGPLIETIEADLSSGMYDSSEIFMGTSSSGIVPKAKITDVEYTS